MPPVDPHQAVNAAFDANAELEELFEHEDDEGYWVISADEMVDAMAEGQAYYDDD